MSAEISIIIPTYNEKDNIVPLLDRLKETLKGLNWEVIYVDDDSDDGTAEFVKELSRQNEQVRCIHRIGRRGLSSACIEGMLSSSAPYMAVMDADLQHDESLLAQMYQTLQEDDLDIVIGSRYVEGGSTGTWSKERKFISQFATKASHLIAKADLKDPMSGFFMLKRDFFKRVVRRLTGKGFKILLDLFSSSVEPVKFKEIPFQFRTRHAGESKLDTLIIWEYGLLILDKLIGKVIPVRFVLFVMVGLSGMLIHLCALGFGLKILNVSFVLAQVCATYLAMTTNFVFDNIFTYHDKRLRGKKFLLGLGSFYVACALGAVINVMIASHLYNIGLLWWAAGLLGAIVGSVWNYAITSTFTWRDKQR